LATIILTQGQKIQIISDKFGQNQMETNL